MTQCVGLLVNDGLMYASVSFRASVCGRSMPRRGFGLPATFSGQMHPLCALPRISS